MKQRKGFFADIGKIKTISIGLIYVFFNIWVIFHIPQYFPSNHEFWFKVFISYGLLNALIFSNEQMRNKLFNVKIMDFLPRFCFFFVMFLVLFHYILTYIDPLTGSQFAQLSIVPLWLIGVESLVFAMTESIIWQGYLDEKIGQPWSAISAGIFHYGVWTGGVLFVVLGAGALFMFFSIVHWYCKQNSSDMAPVIGCHTAFNCVKLGLLLAAGGQLI